MQTATSPSEAPQSHTPPPETRSLSVFGKITVTRSEQERRCKNCGGDSRCGCGANVRTRRMLIYPIGLVGLRPSRSDLAPYRFEYNVHEALAWVFRQEEGPMVGVARLGQLLWVTIDSIAFLFLACTVTAAYHS